jgi:hypothetical protein
MLRTVLVGTAFVFGLVVAAVPAPEAPFGLRLQLVAEAYSQMDQTLFRRCRRAVRREFRPAGCTRRCYPRRFFDANVDRCVMQGGRL